MKPKIYYAHLIPLGFDDGQIDPQEINLIYVAATRAKHQLQINPDIRRLISGAGSRPAQGQAWSGTSAKTEAATPGTN